MLISIILLTLLDQQQYDPLDKILSYQMKRAAEAYDTCIRDLERLSWLVVEERMRNGAYRGVFAWCMTGPFNRGWLYRVSPLRNIPDYPNGAIPIRRWWLSCKHYDEDNDGDIDLKDWSQHVSY